MSVSVRIPTILRTYTGGESEVSAEGETLAEVIDDLEAKYSGIKARILDDQGAIRRFVNVYVGNDDVRFLDNLETKTPDGTQISGEDLEQRLEKLMAFRKFLQIVERRGPSREVILAALDHGAPSRRRAPCRACGAPPPEDPARRLGRRGSRPAAARSRTRSCSARGGRRSRPPRSPRRRRRSRPRAPFAQCGAARPCPEPDRRQNLPRLPRVVPDGEESVLQCSRRRVAAQPTPHR